MNARGSVLSIPRQDAAFLLRCMSFVFLVVGALAAGYVSYVIVDAHTYQAMETYRFHAAPPRRGELPRALADGEIIGQIHVPRIGINVMVVQGDSAPILRRAVGHVPGTALPGERGNVALAGHRDTFFRPLREIRPGDQILMQTPAGQFSYSVDSARVVPPNDVSVLQPSEATELTLITCFPFNFLGAAPYRFIVRARQTEATLLQTDQP